MYEQLERIMAGELVLDESIARTLIARRHPKFKTLTARERDVLRLIAEGRSNVGIARELELSPKTVEVYVAGIFTKLDIPTGERDNRRILAVLAWQRAQMD